MNRIEYMQELEQLLADIPSEEREDAIAYYNDYFDAGGEENEEETIIALGSPAQLASTIKLANSTSEVIDGEFTDAGYEDNLRRDANELDKYSQIDAGNSKGKKRNTGTIILLCILAVFAAPIILPIALGLLSLIFGLLVGAVSIVLGLAVGIIACGIGIFVSGIAGVGVAITTFSSNVFAALCILGLSLIGIGLGIFFIQLCVNLLVKLVPPLVRWFVKLIQNIYKWCKGKLGGKGAAANEEV